MTTVLDSLVVLNTAGGAVVQSDPSRAL
jgi:hypothetical protein